MWNFYRKNRKAFHWLLLLLVIVRLLDATPFFRSLDRSFLDLFARLHVHEVPSEIYIVEITDEDYEKLFCSTSPLNPDTVAKLIDTIEKQGPAVVGVDLDTSDEAWRNLPRTGQTHTVPVCKERDQNKPEVQDVGAEYSLTKGSIIWAGVPKSTSSLNKAGIETHVDCPLGGAIDSPDKIGLVLLPEDSDGVVREHQREFPPFALSCEDKGPVSLAPFDVALKNKCDKNQVCNEDLARVEGFWGSIFERLAEVAPSREQYVDFAGERYSFRVVQAGQFLRAAISLDPSNNPMKDHIVLLGGSYAAARDEYWTPLGKMPGVELFAHGIQSAAAGYTYSASWTPVYIFAFFLDLALGGFLIWLGYLAKQGSIPGWLAVSIGIAAPFVLLYFFYSSNVWLGAVPVVVGICLDHVHEIWTERRELKEENGRLKARNGALERDNKKLSFNQRHLQERERKLVKFADGTVAEEVAEVEEDSGPSPQPGPEKTSKEHPRKDKA
jgi:CHASE2 domain-containing sensor protein